MGFKNIVIQIEKSYYLIQLKNQYNKYFINSIKKDEYTNFKTKENYYLLNFPTSRRHINTPKEIKNDKLKRQFLLEKLDSKDDYVVFFDSIKQSKKDETTVICDEIKKEVYFENIKHFDSTNIQSITNIQFVLPLIAKKFSNDEKVIFVFELNESVEIFIIKDDKAEYYKSIKKYSNIEAIQNEIESSISYILRDYYSFIENNVICLNDVNPDFFLKSTSKITKIDVLSNIEFHNFIEKTSLNKELALLAVGVLLSKESDLNLFKEVIDKRNKSKLIFNSLTIFLILILIYQGYKIFNNFEDIEKINKKNSDLSIKIQEFYTFNNKILNEKELVYLENYIGGKDNTLIKIDEILSQIKQINPNLVLLDIKVPNDKKNGLNLFFEIKEEDIEKLSSLRIAFENDFKNRFKENCTLKCIMDIRNTKLILDLNFEEKTK